MQKPLQEALVGTWHVARQHSHSASAVDTEYFPDNSFRSHGAFAFYNEDEHGAEDILCETFSIEGRWDLDGSRLTEYVDSVEHSGLFVYPQTPIREVEWDEDRAARVKVQQDLIEMALSTVEWSDIVKVEPDRVTLSDEKSGSEWAIVRKTTPAVTDEDCEALKEEAVNMIKTR